MIFNEDLYLRESTCHVCCGVYINIISSTLSKNSPPDCFCLPLVGTVAFESLPGRIYSKTAQQAFAFCAVLASQKYVCICEKAPATFVAVCI